VKQLAWWVVLAATAVAGCARGGDGATTGSVDAWCSIERQLAELESANPGLLDIERADSTALDEYRRLLGEAAEVAPDAVLADANAMADGVDRFVNVGESVGFDFDTLDDAELLGTVADLLALEEPIDRIRAYNDDGCGIAVVAGPGVETPSASASSTTGPVAASDTDAASDDVGEVGFTGDPNSEWCLASRELSALEGDLGADFFSGSEAIESTLSEMLVAFERAADVSPPEIATAAATSLESLRSLDAALAAADYDLLAADLSVLTDLDAEVMAANELIARYNLEVCGIVASPTGEVDAGGFDPTAGSIREQAIAVFVELGFTEQEAACIFDNVDFTDPDLFDDSAALAEVLTICGIDFERLNELGVN
jgi:hypothetical protein